MFRRPILLLVVIVIVLGAAGLLAVGAFPPATTPSAVEHTLPNDRFQTR
jgi:hypothetical protein